jgi:hypothetical protein
LFPNRDGGFQWYGNVDDAHWWPLQRACGFVDAQGKPLFHFHALRHFAATNWLTSREFTL